MIHCDPVVERWTSCWIVGSEIATIVWSMKVIETAKIIAARISFEFLAGVAFIGGAFREFLVHGLRFAFLEEGKGPLVLLVHPSLPAKSIRELIAFAKSRPGAINCGSAGNGTSGHLAGELLKVKA